MALPYQNTSSGKRAIDDIQKLLRGFGCTKFATGEDFENGEIFIQFEHRGRLIHLKASAKGYAAAWLKENPYSSRRRMSKQDHEKHALEVGGIAVYSILRDWVKGQITAIETGILSFDAAFMAHMMLPNGNSLVEEVVSRKMLPAPKEEL